MQPYLQNIRGPRGGDEIASSTRNYPWRLTERGLKQTQVQLWLEKVQTGRVEDPRNHSSVLSVFIVKDTEGLKGGLYP